MTVAELIDKLRELPPDMPVWTFEPYEDRSVPVADMPGYPLVDQTEGSPLRGVYL